MTTNTDTQAHGGGVEAVRASTDVLIDDCWEELCERDDRTSPAEYPDMCLITHAELADFMSRAIEMLQAWRPIEPAPKDGSEILAYSEHGGTGTMLVRHIAMVDFLTDAEIEEYARQGASDTMLEKADWFYADFLQGERLSPDCYPTHWMPVLPAPDAKGER